MKKIFWLMVSCLMVSALVLASCAPAEVEEEEEVITPEEEEVVTPEEEVTEGEGMVKVTATKIDGTTIELWKEKPKYGGEFLVARSSDITGFDPVYTPGSAMATRGYTNEELLEEDYTKTLAGTGEAGYQTGEVFAGVHVGNLAESWEVPDTRTVIFHIRQGMHWHDKPPVNGREFTADDFVYSYMRLYNDPATWHYNQFPPEVREALEATAPDKYTVVVKAPTAIAAEILRVGGNWIFVVPREMVELHGDMTDWQNSCGTGPFELVDYVNMSSATFVRNPNYWKKHPWFGDQLPYVDSMKWLIIPDLSTRISAVRTGKIQSLGGLTWDDAEALMGTNPELAWKENPPRGSYIIGMRTDNPALPFEDINVRYALNLAFNNQAVIDDYYSGYAEMIDYPVSNYPENSLMYIPLEELPEAVQELYGYNPEKAKQLLVEAGYPDGFTASIICTAAHVDLLSIVKDNWEQIGVTLNLEVREVPVYNSMSYRRKFDEMFMAASISYWPRSWNNFIPENYLNKSFIDDPVMNEAIQYWVDNSIDWEGCNRVAKEAFLHAFEQAWYVPIPGAYTFVFWQPWLIGYHGQRFLTSAWIDHELKKEMGH